MTVMAAASTFLAPGQRYAPPDTPMWNLGPQVTVLKVYRGPDGTYRIVQRNRAGEVLQTFATELEAEVEAGLLVPVAGTGRPGSC
jgi:hypothetical protein